jgi:hypothetical protein
VNPRTALAAGQPDHRSIITMGKLVARDVYIAINGTALSDHASSVTFEDTADEVDFTAFGPNAYREFGQGLKDGSITATFFQDYAANSAHAILQPLYASGGTFNLELRPTSAAVSGTNPKVTMVSRLYGYGGLGADVGDAMTFDVTFRNAGTAGPVWGTS